MRVPTFQELKYALAYIEVEFIMPTRGACTQIDGEMWAEGLAFASMIGRVEGVYFNIDHAVKEIYPQLSESDWKSIAARADYLRAEQGLAPVFR